MSNVVASVPPQAPKDKGLHIKVSQADRDLFRAIASQHGLTVSELVRQAIYSLSKTP